MTTTDVIVIGAGPAGSAAARLLAAWGHRVLVVEGDHHVGALTRRGAVHRFDLPEAGRDCLCGP